MSSLLLRVVLVFCTLTIAMVAAASAAPSTSSRSGALEPMDGPQSSLSSDHVLASVSSTVTVGTVLEDGAQVVELVDPKTKQKTIVLQYPPELEPYNLLLCCVWKTTKSKFDGRSIADCSAIDCVKQSKRVTELSAAAALPVDSTNTELLHLLEAQQEKAALQRDLAAAALKQKLQRKDTPVLKDLKINTISSNIKSNINVNIKSQQQSQNIYTAAAAARRLLNEEGEEIGMDSPMLEAELESEYPADTELLEAESTTETETPYQAGAAWQRKEVLWVWSAQLSNLWYLRRTRLQTAFTQAMLEWQQNTCVTFTRQDLNNVNHQGMPITIFGFVTDGNSHTNGIGSPNNGNRDCVIRVDWGYLKDSHRPDARHEIGHVLGLQHTQQRRDFVNFVATHLNVGGACADDWCLAASITTAKKNSAWVNQEIAPLLPANGGFNGRVNAIVNNAVPGGGFAGAAAQEFRLKRDALINMKAKVRYQGRMSAVTNFLTWAGPIGEGFTEDDVRTALAYAEQAISMEYQYQPFMNIDLTSQYDFRSIMHYPLDNCLTSVHGAVLPGFANGGFVGNPGVISALDADSICQMYRCGTQVHASGTTPSAVGAVPTVWRYNHYFPQTKTLGEIRTFIADFIQANPNAGLAGRSADRQYENLNIPTLVNHIRNLQVRTLDSQTPLANDAATLLAIATVEAQANVNANRPYAVQDQADILAGGGNFQIQFY